MHENDTFDLQGEQNLFVGFGWETSGIVDISAILVSDDGYEKINFSWHFFVELTTIEKN